MKPTHLDLITDIWIRGKSAQWNDLHWH